MSRTLNRPMFRRGGKVDSRGTGITTGLMPRKNYAQGDLVTGPGGMSEGDTINYMNQQNPNINTTLGVNSDYDSISELMGDRQKLRDEFGLNYEIPEPEKGLSMSDYVNIFGTGADILLTQNPDTVGEKVKNTTSSIASNIDKRKIKEQQDIEKAFGVTSSDFESAYKTLTDKQKSEYDRETLLKVQQEKNAGTLKTKTYNTQIEDTMLEGLQQELATINDKLKTAVGEEREKLIAERINLEERKRNIITGADDILNFQIEADIKDGGPMSKQINSINKKNDEIYEQQQLILDYDQAAADGNPVSEDDKKADREELELLEQELKILQAGLANIMQGFRLTQDAALSTTYAKGGRVGLQQGGPPNSQANSVEMPSYDLLRSKLPPEISNEVIRLLSMSPQALAAFAEIETEQDVANFNNTFQTNLVIPSGA